MVKDMYEQDNSGRKKIFLISGAIILVLILFISLSRCSGGDDKSEDGQSGGSGTSESESPVSPSESATQEPDSDGETIPSESGAPSSTYTPPKPGENRAIPKDPNGKTVWDRWKPNRSPVAPGVTGYGGWGSVYWPTVGKPKELTTPEPNPPYQRMKVTSPNSRENKSLTKGAVETTVELFNINTRDYASLACGMSESRRATGNFKRDMGLQCRKNREPSIPWEQMQNKGAILYVSNLADFAEGQTLGYTDNSQNAFRGYKATISAADQNGKPIKSIKASKYILYMTFSPVNGNYYIDKMHMTPA